MNLNMTLKDLRSFVPTLTDSLGIQRPGLATCAPFDEFISLKGKVKKALIYCPDAFGMHALARFPELEKRLRAMSTVAVDLSSVFPPVTPVCFATLFTGASPAEHGIRYYEKPVLACDTLFDALVRARKSVAIVAVQNSSIDKIFQNRPIDYFSMGYDSLVTAKVLELQKENKHDVIVAYHQEYDDLLHETGPFSALAEKALMNHVDTWEVLRKSSQENWKQEYLLAFTPDHGGHLDPNSGRGDHGKNIPEDMRLRHFFEIK